jgi:hypothetical protein
VWWSSLPWWFPPAEQRLSAYFPSENAEPRRPPRAGLTPKNLQLSRKRARQLADQNEHTSDQVEQPSPDRLSASPVSCPTRFFGLRRLGSPAFSWPRLARFGLPKCAKAGTIMAPVYVVVKARSTTYCVLFWPLAQDMDKRAESRGILLNDLFCKALRAP